VNVRIQKRRASRQRKIANQLARRKQRSIKRLKRSPKGSADTPVLACGNIRYEMADRQRGISYGGIGVMMKLAQHIGLPKAIDDRLHLLKFHVPYHESDHVLNFALNALCDGRCLQDIELRRNDEVFLDAIGAERIPDPTTAGDFCRRFLQCHLDILHDVFDDARLQVWARQPAKFFRRATVDCDGTLVETAGEKKEGVDIAYDGTWSYHPLVCSLAETGEVLRVINRSGNRPSHEGAAAQTDGLIQLLKKAGFVQIVLRGDTDFSQTKHLDRWAAEGAEFVFGYDGHKTLNIQAELVSESDWKRLQRPPAYQVATVPRRKHPNHKQKIVSERMFRELRLESEDVAEFEYRPIACKNTYRMIVVRKNLAVCVAQQRLFPETRYFYYISNMKVAAEEIVFEANGRCNQENLIEQLHNGCRALRAGLNTLEANGACMLMTALAWNLKAWAALWLPETPGPHRERHQAEKQKMLRCEFRTFLNNFMRLPCQIIKTSRRVVYRLLSWNPHLPTFFRLVHALRC